MIRASGLGSWPTVPVREAVETVRDRLAGDQLPYLPELPGRGPGADMVGRTASLLVAMPVDLQPSGWRLADHVGRDVQRGRGYLSEDLDELAQAYDGYVGPLKVQLVGPWTLAASLWLPRGDLAVADRGASRDLAESLTEGARQHLAAVRALVPGADLVLQLDEPSLPAVLAGRLKTASGYGRLRSVDAGVVETGLRTVLSGVAEAADSVVIHCCAPDVPWALLRRLGTAGVSVDTSLLTARGWESMATLVEAGTTLWAGLLPTDTTTHPREMAVPFLDSWRRVGLADASLDGLVVTPACGLTGATRNRADAIQALAVDVAAALGDAIA